MSVTHLSRGAILPLILAAASWGIGTVVSKRAVEEIPPLTLLPIQLAASLIVLALLMRLRRLPLHDPSMTSGLGRLGLLNPGIAYALSLLGLTTITASLSVLLWAMEPVLILFLAAWFLHERIEARFVALSLIAISGMLLGGRRDRVGRGAGHPQAPIGVGRTRRLTCGYSRRPSRRRHPAGALGGGTRRPRR